MYLCQLYNLLMLNWYLSGVEMNLGHTHKTRFWYLLGVFSKFCDEHTPVTFIEENPPRPWGRASPYKHLLSSPLSIGFSLHGRREKGKGKGIEGARLREGGGEEGNLPFLFFLLHALSHAQISPSLSPFNACHAGYIGLKSSL